MNKYAKREYVFISLIDYQNDLQMLRIFVFID